MSDDTKLVMGAPHGAHDSNGEHFAWLVRPSSGEERESYAYFGMNAANGNYASILIALDDAEAIGYSLLYAVKLQRDKEANGND